MNQTIENGRSEYIVLARPNCAYCEGSGLLPSRRAGEEHPCSCIYRAIFKACYLRFRECTAMGRYMSTVSLEWTNGPVGKRYYGRKIEEYVADFCCVSRRTLSENQYRLFRYHYILGADWKLCCRVLKLDKGDFFHHVYRIEHVMGRTFVELKPYPLFPLYEYFGPSNEALFGNGSGVARRSIKQAVKSFHLQKIA